MTSKFTEAPENVKPCPFCGAQPIIHEWTFMTKTVWWIMHCIANTGPMQNIEEAIAQWNKRPGDLQETEEKEREVVG